MEDIEETDPVTNSEPEIKRLKLQKAKAKSAFTKARHRVLALLTDTETDQVMVKKSWEQVESAHEAASEIMWELSHLLIQSDGDGIDNVIIELDRLDVEFSEAFNQYQSFLLKLKDTVQSQTAQMNPTSSSDEGGSSTPRPTGIENDNAASPPSDSNPQIDEGGEITAGAEAVGSLVNAQQFSLPQNTEGQGAHRTTAEGSVSPPPNIEGPVMDRTTSEGGQTRTRVQRPPHRPTPANDAAVGADMWKQLKRVAIPVFSGEVKQYENWKAAFLACIDAAPATPEYKLLQLRQYLSGEALKVIENLGHSAAAYQAARERLDRKYGGKRRQVTLQFEELSDFKTIRSGNAKDVERFADLLDITIINLKDTGLYSELDSKLLYHVLLKKMTEGMVTEYQRWVKQNAKQESIEILRDWVVKEAEYRTVAHEAIRGLSELVAGAEASSGRKARAFVTDSNPEPTKRACKLCGGGHGLWFCPEFKELTVTQRWSRAKQTGACFRCLGDNHRGSSCRRSRECGIGGCTKSHHRMLHDGRPNPTVNSGSGMPNSTGIAGEIGNRAPTEGEQHGELRRPQNATLVTGSGEKSYVALRTVPVIVKNGRRRIKVNALLDDASTSTFVNADVAAELGLQGESQRTEVNVLNGKVESFVTMPVEFGIESLDRQVDIQIVGTTVEQVTGDLQVVDWNQFRERWPHLKDIPFPKFGKRHTVDLLIGVDQVDLHFSLRDICGNPGEPIARRTRLGWTCIGGPIKLEGGSHTNFARVYFSHQRNVMEDLNESVRQFWEVESFGVAATKQCELNLEEKRAMGKVKKSMVYNMGRYQVGVPWREDSGPTLPLNRAMAESRLKSTERRLMANPCLGRDYSDVIDRYLSEGYIRKVEKSEGEGGAKWFLPHFPVVRPDKATTKTRIVFDASAKYQGISLNSKIHQGPKLQSDLFNVLLRFRKNPVALVCDIKEMYLQIELAPQDRPYHRFLWRDLDPSQPPQEYEFNRVVFGVNASPFLAQFVAQEHARERESEFPLAAETIQKSTYMDDSMDSALTEKDGCEMYQQLTTLWGLAGMRARKWLSNSAAVLCQIPEEDRISELRLEEGEFPSVKTLGVLWRATEDVFTFEMNPPPTDYPWTKRNILRKLAAIFDPLGFISPFIIRGKMLLQELWVAGVDWDDPVPGSVATKASKWFGEIADLGNIRLPRCLKLDDSNKFESMNIHTFVDASQDAYGAVVYAVTSYKSGEIVSRLVASKSKVAPLSATSIPRLELMSAVIGLRLAKSVCEALGLELKHTVFWSDSMNVLWWVRGRSRKFKPFVAHRVGEIQDSTNPEQWRYVPTKINPADIVTRGMTANNLVDAVIWWSGPFFLVNGESQWPENKIEEGTQEENRKCENISLSMMAISLPPGQSAPDDSTWRLTPERFSSWLRLLRVQSWVKRFIRNCRVPEEQRQRGALTPGELQEVETHIIRQEQCRAFPEEYRSLESNRPISGKSKILGLNPKIDDEGLLRCDGRLRNAEYLSYDTRYPVILPRRSWVTKLIVKHYHEQRGHTGGTNQTYADLSSRFWIIAAREEIRAWERECQGCRRLRSKTASQIMAPLPDVRVKLPLRAFARTAVDFAGPFLTKQGRGRAQQKRYLCLFTCVASRAVHLEIAFGLDTDSFLNALHRMINRRGVPKEIISDNGTNFVRADRELRNLVSQLDRQKVEDSTSSRGIRWHFNPPLGPHFGGVHETLIKAAKKAITAIGQRADITDEELMTVFTGAEALLNSRPLTYQTSNVHDDMPLTPNHFLHGQLGGQFAVDAVDTSDFNPRRRWRRVQELVRHFWHRWMKEWLPLLNQRKKWQLPQKDLKVGDVVVVADAGSARGKWPLGRVVEVFPGVDGHVRVVKLQVGKSVFTRPITKLCSLVDSED